MLLSTTAAALVAAHTDRLAVDLVPDGELLDHHAILGQGAGLVRQHVLHLA